MSGADTANTTGLPGVAGTIPPASTGTPAAEWSDKVLEAVNAPSAHTGGYAEASGTAPGGATATSTEGVGSRSTAAPSGTSSGLAGGMGSASGVPSFGLGGASGSSGVGGEQTSDDTPVIAKVVNLFTGGGGGASGPSSAPVTGGGLATSANVPQPGASLSSSTGLPHQEGLTRDELSRAEESARLKLEELSGREQAAAQLQQQAALQQAEAQQQQEIAARQQAAAQQQKVLAKEQLTAQSEVLSAREKTAAQLEDLSSKEQAAAQIEQLSGRQQATAQLGNLGMPPSASATTAAPSSVGELTPGKELPGGWGHTNPVPAPGTSSTEHTTTIYEDVTHALDKVGQAAFSVVPQPLVDKVRGVGKGEISPTQVASDAVNQAKQALPESLSTTTRSGADTTTTGQSGQSLLQQAKQTVGMDQPGSTTDTATTGQTGTSLLEQAKHAVGLDQPASSTTTGQTGPSLLEQAKQYLPNAPQFLGGAGTSTGTTVTGAVQHAKDTAAQAVGSVTGKSHPVGPHHHPHSDVVSSHHEAGPAKSMPSEEVEGQHAYDHSSGVGSLPGTINESGVAILPEERIHPNPYAEKGFTSPIGVGDLPGKPTESGVAILPEERIHPNPYGEKGFTSPIGVGDLPGKPNESGVVRTPEERIHPNPFEERGFTSPIGVGDLPGDADEAGVARTPEERIHPDPWAEAGKQLAAPGGSLSGERGISGGALGSVGQTRATSTSAGTTGVTGAGSGYGSGASGVDRGLQGSASGVSGAGTSVGTAELAPPLGAFGTSGDISTTDRTGDKPRETGEPVVPVGASSGAYGSGAGEPAIASATAVPHRMAASDRADSTTSTTAIRHGEPGDRHHKSILAGAGPENVLEKTGSTAAESRSPGAADKSEGAGTAFAPTSQAADVSPTDKSTVGSEPHRDVKEEFAAVGHGTMDQPASAAPARQAETTETSTGAAHGHDSNGKKSGFLAKVKAKLHHDK